MAAFPFSVAWNPTRGVAMIAVLKSNFALACLKVIVAAIALTLPVSAQAESPVVTDCPTAITTHASYNKTVYLQFRALKNRILTKKKLEEYYEELISVRAHAARFRAEEHQAYLGYPNYEEDPQKIDLIGCGPGENPSFSECGAYEVYGPGDLHFEDAGLTDTVTARLNVYECHRNAGWPSATDFGSKAASKKESSAKLSTCDCQGVIGVCSATIKVVPTKSMNGSYGADLTITSSAKTCSKVHYYVDGTPYMNVLRGKTTDRIFGQKPVTKETVSGVQCRVCKSE